MVLGKGSGSSTGEDDGDVLQFQRVAGPIPSHPFSLALMNVKVERLLLPTLRLCRLGTLTPRPKMLTVPLDRAVFSGALLPSVGVGGLYTYNHVYIYICVFLLLTTPVTCLC